MVAAQRRSGQCIGQCKHPFLPASKAVPSLGAPNRARSHSNPQSQSSANPHATRPVVVRQVSRPRLQTLAGGTKTGPKVRPDARATPTRTRHRRRARGLGRPAARSRAFWIPAARAPRHAPLPGGFAGASASRSLCRIAGTRRASRAGAPAIRGRSCQKRPRSLRRTGRTGRAGGVRERP